MSNKPNRNVSNVTNMLGTLSKDVVQNVKQDNVDAKALRKAQEQLDEMKAKLEQTTADAQAKLEQTTAEIQEYIQRSIVPQADGSFEFQRFKFTAVGLNVPDDISEIEVNDFLLALKEADDAIAWTVGDLANAAETKWGKTYDQLERATGYKYQTLMDYAYVARQVDFSIRIEKLKFGHHRVVAPLKVSEQKHWLRQCAKNEWSVAELKRQIADSKRKPSVIIDALHRDMLPKFGKAESAIKRALKTQNAEDVKRAKEELYQSRQATESYFEALEDELNNLGKDE